MTLSSEGELLTTESMAVVSIHRHATGGALYVDWREFPYVQSQYGPSFYLVPSAIAALLDLDVHACRLLGRGISLAAYLGLVGLLLLEAHALAGGWLPALVAVGLLVGTELMAQFAAMVRADLPSLFFQVAGLALLRRSAAAAVSSGELRASRLLISLPFFVAAGSYKQVGVMGAVAGAAWLLATGRLRAGALLLGSFAAAGVAGVLGAQLLTGGMFLHGTISGQLFPSDPANRIAVFLAASRALPLLALGVAGCAVRSARRAAGPFVAYLALGLLWGSFGTLHTGAWVHYFFEAAVGATLVLAALLAGRFWLPGLLALLLASFLATTCVDRIPFFAATLATSEDEQAVRGLYDALVKEVQAEPGVLFTDDAWLAALAGREDEATDPYDVSSLVEAGRLDDREARELIAAGRANPIIMRHQPQGGLKVPRWPASWSRAMEGRYRLVRRYRSGHNVYRPVEAQGPF